MLFHFGDDGVLAQREESPIKVTILSFQTRKTSKRDRAPNGKPAVDFVMNHVTAFERPRFAVEKLGGFLRAAELAPEDAEALSVAVKKIGFVPGALYQCLQNEWEKKKDPATGQLVDRKASWDFLVESKTTEAVRIVEDAEGAKRSETVKVTEVFIVQTNRRLDDRYSWHGALSKTDYVKRASGQVVKNRDGAVVWDGKAQIFPRHHPVNEPLIGIENSFYGGPMKKVGEKIFYPFGAKLVDVTAEERRNGALAEFEGKIFEVASPIHMEILAQLNAAICDRYGLAKERVIGHYHADPLNRPFDPLYTCPIGALRQRVGELAR